MQVVVIAHQVVVSTFQNQGKTFCKSQKNTEKHNLLLFTKVIIQLSTSPDSNDINTKTNYCDLFCVRQI